MEEKTENPVTEFSKTGKDLPGPEGIRVLDKATRKQIAEAIADNPSLGIQVIDAHRLIGNVDFRRKLRLALSDSKVSSPA